MSGENTVSSDEKALDVEARAVALGEPMCDHICVLPEDHVEAGHPHFYGYRLGPGSPSHSLAEVQRLTAERDRARDAAVALEQELARKDQALDEIRALHKPERIVTVGGSDEMCAHCRVRPKNAYDIAWPCATQRILSDLAAALDAHLNKEDNGDGDR